MKLRNRTKQTALEIKQEDTTADFTTLGTMRKAVNYRNTTSKGQILSTSSKVKVQEEDLAIDKCIRKIENNQTQNINTIEKADLADVDTFQKMDSIDVQIKQEVTTKSEVLLSENPGISMIIRINNKY